MAARRSFSTFAQEQLEKHGWKDGQGLGRTESGISEAIKVKIKQDTAGVGHDLGEQFTYHWWDHVFNKAASNIVVEKDQDGVKLSRKETITGPISNKKSLKNKGKKPLLYGNFVKSATLSAEGLQRDGCDDSSSSSSEDGDGEGMNIDDKFFKACGGRTAHKGARHGLNLSGKLKRIQAQEENGHLPRPMKDNSTESPKPPLRNSDKTSAKESKKDRKRKKKQRKREKEGIVTERTVENSHLEPVTMPDISHRVTDDRKGYDCISTSDNTKQKKNKKNKRKKLMDGESNTHEYSLIDINNEESDTKRKGTTEISLDYAAVDVTNKKKKKHKRNRTKENVVDHEYLMDNQEVIDVTKEKKRKDKRKRTQENGNTEHEYSADN